MEIELFLFGIFVFWLAYRIAQKAGVNPWWIIVIIIPVVNIVMIWVFAFMQWPNLPQKFRKTFDS